MINLLDINKDTGWAIFSIGAVSDLADLPTTTEPGEVRSFKGTVTAGSIAYLTDGSFGAYVLDETDNWNAKQ